MVSFTVFAFCFLLCFVSCLFLARRLRRNVRRLSLTTSPSSLAIFDRLCVFSSFTFQYDSFRLHLMRFLLVCQTTKMERGAPLADHFTILGRVVVTREPAGRDGEPRCRLLIGFDVAFHKVMTPATIEVQWGTRFKSVHNRRKR